MNALQRISIPTPPSVEDTLLNLREKLTNTQPHNTDATLALLSLAADTLEDYELKEAIAEVRCLESSNPLYMEKYSDLLATARDAFSFLEVLAQVVALEIERLGYQQAVECLQKSEATA